MMPDSPCFHPAHSAIFMVSKQTIQDSHVNDFRSSITFVIYPSSIEDSHELVVELSAAGLTDSVVRVLDSQRNILLEEFHFFPESGSHSYTLRDLEPGTYIFEISDDFFHQVKEVHLAD